METPAPTGEPSVPASLTPPATASGGMAPPPAPTPAPPPPRGLLVTGTDTGVGKTVLSASIVAAIAATGARVHAYKPVVTGLDEPAAEHDGQGTWPHDHELLASLCGIAPERVAPLRFGPAVSPHLAAELAGERVRRDGILAATREAAAAARSAEATLIVEGVGGLLVPLTDELSVRQLACELRLPLLVAARPSLGTINHTLLTLQAARAASLAVRAVVLTPWPSQPSTLERSNRETIERLGEVDVVTLPRVPEATPEALAAAGATLPWRAWLGAPSG
ncbi:MAG: dethiobiotin synthase [Solirubrobacteraceae bacterium]